MASLASLFATVYRCLVKCLQWKIQCKCCFTKITIYLKLCGSFNDHKKRKYMKYYKRSRIKVLKEVKEQVLYVLSVSYRDVVKYLLNLFRISLLSDLMDYANCHVCPSLVSIEIYINQIRLVEGYA